MKELEFPKDRNKIAGLNYDGKLAWYHGQFQKDPHGAAVLFSTPEFQRFWKWHMVLPLRIKRFLYRLKTLQVFKHYEHITDMKAKLKKNGV